VDIHPAQTHNMKTKQIKSIRPKEYTLNRHDTLQAQYLQEAYQEGFEQGLRGSDLFKYTEKKSLESWNNTAR